MTKEGRFNIIIIILLTLLAGIVWYTYYNNAFTGLLYNDAMDYASMGRNIARGEGVTSSYITPLGLQFHGIPHPNPWRAPLWPVTLAFSMKILGFNDNAAALTSGLFFVLTVPLIYLIGRKMFGVTIGITSAVVFSFSSLALHFSVSGLTEPMAVFLMSLWLYTLTVDRLSNPLGSFIIGAVGGIFYLARYNALMVAPFVFLYLVWRSNEKRALTAVLFSTGFILPVLPWLWRNYALFGSPMFSLQKFEPVMFTPSYPEYTLYMMMEKPPVREFMVNHFPEIIAKVKAGFLTFSQGLLSPEFSGVNALLMALFLIAVFVPFKKEVRWLKFIVISSFAAQLLALLLVHYIPRLFFIFTPFYIIFGLGLIQRVSGLVSTKYRTALKVVVIAGFSLFVITANLPDWDAAHNPEPSFKKFSPQINYMANVAKKNDLIVSNDGHIISWYGDRVASKIPYSPDMLPELNRYQEAKFIFLSSKASWNIPEADKDWQRIYWNKPREIYGYVIQKVFKDGSVVYVKE